MIMKKVAARLAASNAFAYTTNVVQDGYKTDRYSFKPVWNIEIPDQKQKKMLLNFL